MRGPRGPRGLEGVEEEPRLTSHQLPPFFLTPEEERVRGLLGELGPAASPLPESLLLP